jgi:ubiquinone/menaquinone biosynthesis C-methylase UbiE
VITDAEFKQKLLEERAVYQRILNRPMFEVAEAYERQRGRSSKVLAPLFVDVVGVQGEVLDVGCGTGELTFVIAENDSVSKITGVDPSEGFLAYARFKAKDQRIHFEIGDAQNLRFADATFDQCLTLLVMRFIPDATRAVKEMRRVTRRGGVVATAMWDTTGRNELKDSLFDAALIIDPDAPQEKNTPRLYGTAEELEFLARLETVEVQNIVFQCGFDSVDDFCQPLTKGQGPNGAYLRRMANDQQAALRELLRHNLFGNRADGPFSLKAKAWAVRGVVP